MNDIDRFKQDIVFDVRLGGHDFTFYSTWGLFSPRRIDDGTYMLAQKVDPGPEDVTLDLGCGYGAIGLAIAKCCPGGTVHMADKDFVAVEYAKKNAIINGLDNCRAYLSNAFSEVPDIHFDNIVSNLPANVGRELLSIILQDAKAHLKEGGSLYIVTVAGLRKFIRRNLQEVFGNYKKLKQGKTYTVALAIKEGIPEQ
ncbi:MAG: methyltransferase [Planctomycetota bacterium]|nr:methyltransferase [Planctomycetota bacterium]